MSLDVETITPRLSQVILSAINVKIKQLHIAMPGEVVSYADGVASVLPLLKRKYKGEPPHALPIINLSLIHI